MRVFVLVVAIRVCAPAAAAEPAATFDKLTPGQWLSYEVPAVEAGSLPCCFQWQQGRSYRRPCSLDGSKGWQGTNGDARPATTRYENLRLFIRRARPGFDRVVAVGSSCIVEPQGRSVTELTGVTAKQSVAFLESYLRDQDHSQRSRDGLAALAHHRGKAATQALVRLAAPGQASRRDAYFWLAHKRGQDGLQEVLRALNSETSEKLARHLVFCLSQSPEPEMLAELKRVAGDLDDERLSGEALFWLAQREDPDVESIAMAVLDADPSSSAEKKAVFCLSQLPADRAIAALTGLVRSDRPRFVRRQALFWLAQQDDDRILTEFDAIFEGRTP